MVLKLGPIVRVRPNTLSFRDARLLPVVYHRKVDKGSYYDYLKSVAGLFTIVNHSEHAIHRKMVAAPVCIRNLVSICRSALCAIGNQAEGS